MYVGICKCISMNITYERLASVTVLVATLFSIYSNVYTIFIIALCTLGMLTISKFETRFSIIKNV